MRDNADNLRPAIDRSLNRFLDALSPQAPARLVEAMRYSLLAPGKRLRPTLVVLACRAAGGDPLAAIPAACAVEMIHTYSLVHDDLPAMDDDDLRRGMPTCHRKFGEAMGILAGDALLTLAFEILASNYSPRIASACIRELAVGAGACGMVGGQVLDLAAEGRIDGLTVPRKIEDLEAIHLGKTGGLYRASLRMGLAVARADSSDGVPEELATAFDRFSRGFGLAFQIADDLIDVEGSSDIEGKRVGKDAARGKLTFPELIGVEASRRLAAELYRDAIDSLAGIGPLAEPLAELARQRIRG